MSPGNDGWRFVEAAATGLAFSGLLAWGTTCLVGSFRPQGLAEPYWQAVPGLRTDTFGIAAFVIAACSLPVSEYFRFRRRAAGPLPGPAKADARASRPGGPAALIARAVAETVAILTTFLAGYLSVNAVTHPATLLLHATHLLPWPSEGTLRALALILCCCSVSVLGFLRSGPSRQRDRTSVPGSS